MRERNGREKNLVVLLGPTASGKTALAARIAYDFKGEIISADSRQVYRGMDIGTGKDRDQYVVNGEEIPCHLIDIIDPQEEFSVYDFQRLFYLVFEEIRKRDKLPVLVGGTGLYLESVLLGYQMPPILDRQREKVLEEKGLEELRDMLSSFQPNLHNTTDWTEKNRIIRRILIEEARRAGKGLPHRPDVEAAVFGIRWEREKLRKRIALRLKDRLNKGLIEEVENLYQNGLSWEKLESFGLEYKYVARYLQGLFTRAEMEKRLGIAIGQFAKRQETWFRRMERRGVFIDWIDEADYEKLKARVALALGHA